MADETNQSAPRIAPDKLAALTGYTLAELKTLANKGYFPKSDKAGYDASQALVGCLRARKEESERAGSLPTFTSMGQAASATGIPLSVLRSAKKAGCPAFAHSRFQLARFLPWFFDRDSDDTDWTERLKKAQALREEHRLAVDKNQTADKGKVTFVITRAISMLFASLDRRADQLPSVLHGMDAKGVKAKLTESTEQLKADLKAEFSKL